MTMDFRTRSADVRREAADILWRFRSGRAARRGAAPDQSAVDSTGPTGRTGVPVSPETEELIRAARADGTHAEAGQDSLPAEDAAATLDAPDADPAGPAPGAPDDGPAEAVMAEPKPEPAPAAADERTVEATPVDVSGTQPAVTDLTDLPGVGAGLVWLLGRCGIHSLADLAAADAARLEQDLGPVGQLLDLPSWIDLARQGLVRMDGDDGETVHHERFDSH